MRKTPHFVVFGRILPFEQMEGGRVRMSYVTGAFDRLGVGVTRVHPVASVRWSAFLLALVLTKLGLMLLSPFRRVYLAASGTPPAIGILSLLCRRCEPLFFDVMDDQRLQFRDLEIKERRVGEAEAFGRTLDFAIARFRRVGFPSEEFADMYAIDASRKVVTPNAADPAFIEATPLPNAPVVALVGGATRGRGADLLIDACTLAREQVPDLKLRLALGNVSRRGYLSALAEEYGRTPWIRFERVDYRTVSEFLKGTYACVVPHRQTFYLDLALPVKLFDYMAAGRPVIVTRCRAMAQLVEAEGVGVVTDFTPEDLAAGIVTVLSDRTLAERLGRSGRRAVEQRYNWRRTQDNVLSAVRSELEKDAKGGAAK